MGSSFDMGACDCFCQADGQEVFHNPAPEMIKLSQSM